MVVEAGGRGVKLEPGLTALGADPCLAGRARGDVVARGFDAGRTLVLDVVLSHPLSGEGEARLGGVKHVAAAAEEAKEAKYRHRLDVAVGAAWRFEPFGLTTAGARGPRAQAFLRECAARYSQAGFAPLASARRRAFLQRWSARLGIVLHQHLALQSAVAAGLAAEVVGAAPALGEARLAALDAGVARPDGGGVAAAPPPG